MKKILLMACVVFSAFITNLNAQSFFKGDNLVKIGYGAPTITGAIFNTYRDYEGFEVKNSGAIYLKYEHALTDKIGLGLNVAYTKNKASYIEEIGGAKYNASVERTSVSALARINFHFATSEKFDAFFGPGIGYRTANWKITSDSPNGSSSSTIPTLIPFGLDFTIGANYYLTDNFGLFAEAGIARSPIQFGLVGKF